MTEFKSAIPYNMWDISKMTKGDLYDWSEDAGIPDKVMKLWKSGATCVSPTLLDLGTFLGRNAFDFARNGFKVHGIDINPLALNYAKRRSIENNMNIEFKLMDMFNMSYPENFFHFVYADNILSLTNTTGMIRAIDEIHRVLVPGGQAFTHFISKDFIVQNEPGKQIDKNSFMQQAQFGDHQVPYCYIDSGMYPELFKGFKRSYDLLTGPYHYTFIITKTSIR